MVRTISNPRRWFRNRFPTLHVFVRRTHRILGALWLLSVPLSYAVSTTGGEIPGPSIPALSIIASIFTGGYLLVRPWVRHPSAAWERFKGLRNWRTSFPVFVRRTHRISGALWLLSLAVALAMEVTVGTPPPVLLVPVVTFLVILSLSGAVMLLRPWVNRLRAR